MSRTTRTPTATHFTTKEGEPREIKRGTPRQKCSAQELLFCEHYSVHAEGAGAAIHAGYSVSTAKQMAQKILQRPCVKRELEEIYAARRAKNEITAEKVIAELAKVGFAEIGKATGIKDSSKVAALAHLAKIVGIMSDRVEHSGSIASTPVPENVSAADAKEAYLKVIK
jgi:phage terminase small subunit